VIRSATRANTVLYLPTPLDTSIATTHKWRARDGQTCRAKCPRPSCCCILLKALVFSIVLIVPKGPRQTIRVAIWPRVCNKCVGKSIHFYPSSLFHIYFLSSTTCAVYHLQS
jgi:hypothetical protein